MKPSLHLTLAALLWPSLLFAQTHHGVGMSGRVGARVAVDYIREQWGPPDSVRLAAVVIWRGRAVWSMTRGEAEAEQARKSTDSAQAVSREHGRMGGGTITPRAAAWMEYDSGSHTAFVLGQAFTTPSRDSTLVLLVDNIDRVAAEPSVTAMVIPSRALVDESQTPGRDGQQVVEAHMAMEANWDAIIRRHPAIREFLDKPSR